MRMFRNLLIQKAKEAQSSGFTGLCFTANQSGSTVKWVMIDSTESTTYPDIKYSIDKINWQNLAKDTDITLENVGDKVYFKGNNPNGVSCVSDEAYMKFVFSNGSISASGNINSLLDDGDGSTITTIPNDYCFFALFYNNPNITTPPDLPATTLTTGCYSYIFGYCTSLTEAPALPATNLASYCYQSMFYGCSSITSLPTLPATTIPDYAYNQMFRGTSITSTPNYSFVSVGQHGIEQMFRECTSLTTAGNLYVDTIGDSGCMQIYLNCTALTTAGTINSNYFGYRACLGMFQNCTSLTSAGAVGNSSSVISEQCLNTMFYGCTSLINAPALLATTLTGRDCYAGMFQNCSSLNQIKINYTGPFDYSYFYIWVSGVSSTGNFYYNGTDTTRGVNAIPEGWTVVGTELCFTAKQANSTVGYSLNGTLTSVDIKYSIDHCKTWTTLSTGTNIILSNIGDKVYFKGNNPNGLSTSSNDYMQFATTGNISLSGNVNSLLDDGNGSTITSLPCDYCFYGLFKDNTIITDASEMIFNNITLSSYCYSYMFYGCYTLVSAPYLASMHLAEECYSFMFQYCRVLVNIPDILPATTLANGCYMNMFALCFQLNKVPVLPATVMTEKCYSNMFNWSYNLTVAPELPSTQLAKECYSGMLAGTAITRAPYLPATELVDKCYKSLFSACSDINYVKLAYTGNFNSNFTSWFNSASNNGDFYYNGSDTTRGIDAIPEGWTVHTF